jgi:hypothetical protein
MMDAMVGFVVSMGAGLTLHPAGLVGSVIGAIMLLVQRAVRH